MFSTKNNSQVLYLFCLIFFLIGIGIKAFANNISMHKTSLVLFFINIFLLSWVFIKKNLNNNIKNIQYLKINIGSKLLPLIGMIIGFFILKKSLLDGTFSMYFLLINFILIILIFCGKTNTSHLSD